MDREKIIKRLQFELKKATDAQEAYEKDSMTEMEGFKWTLEEGRVTLLQELLVDFIGSSGGI